MSRAEDYHIFKQLNPDEQDLRRPYSKRHTPAIFDKMKSAPEIKETVEERNERVEKEDKAIAYYLEVYETQGLEAAQKAFWEIHK